TAAGASHIRSDGSGEDVVVVGVLRGEGPAVGGVGLHYGVVPVVPDNRTFDGDGALVQRRVGQGVAGAGDGGVAGLAVGVRLADGDQNGVLHCLIDVQVAGREDHDLVAAVLHINQRLIGQEGPNALHAGRTLDL